MKSMTCRELGGACELVFRAESFEEMAKASQQHGREMFQRGDSAHLAAMEQMKSRMQSAEAMATWMADMRRAFDAKPHDA